MPIGLPPVVPPVIALKVALQWEFHGSDLEAHYELLKEYLVELSTICLYLEPFGGRLQTSNAPNRADGEHRAKSASQ